MDPAKAGVSFDLRSTSMEWDDQGWMTGNITQFNAIDANGQSIPIVLESLSLNKGRILTKRFGTIEARHRATFPVEYLMQDSELKLLQKMLREYSASNPRWMTDADGIRLEVNTRDLAFTNNFTKSAGTVDSLSVHDASGHSAEIPLKSSRFQDGIIHTADYGDIYFTLVPPQDADVLSVKYGFKASDTQIQQLKSLLSREGAAPSANDAEWLAAEKAATVDGYLKFYKSHPTSDKIKVLSGTVRGRYWESSIDQSRDGVLVTVEGTQLQISITLADAERLKIIGSRLANHGETIRANARTFNWIYMEYTDEAMSHATVLSPKDLKGCTVIASDDGKNLLAWDGSRAVVAEKPFPKATYVQDAGNAPTYSADAGRGLDITRTPRSQDLSIESHHE